MIIKLVIGVSIIVSFTFRYQSLDCLLGFHGPSGQYTGVYGEKRMRQLAEMTAKYFLNNSLELFFYFNNTDSDSPPAAIQDCRYLAQAFKDLKIMSE
jgi:uncharacterized protein YecE (DUF72 family)